MSLRLAIDGYNLISFIDSGLGDIEEQRGSLIESLCVYKKLRRVKITVVFDGTYSGNLGRESENRGGVTIVYSKNGEEADRVIKEMAHAFGNGLTVVSSDADIARYAGTQGSVVISSAEFAERLEAALYEEMKGVDPDEDDYEEDRHGRKKGPAKRTARSERRRRHRLKKL